MLNWRINTDPYQDPRSRDFRFRKKRYLHVKALIEAVLARQDSCRIVDLGGTQDYWNVASDQVGDPRIQVDLVNLRATQITKPNFRSLTGDASDLNEFEDMSYDIVHSNSLIEHVGTWSAMARLATNVRRLAPAYFVQTPYFWFPIEPHFRLPLVHWLPESLRYRLIMLGDMGYIQKANSVPDAVQAVESISLLDYYQFSTLFPDAEIKQERFAGITKSLMAIRRHI